MDESYNFTDVLFPGTQASRRALSKVLQDANATGKYWIGASDLEELGKFRWFYSGKSIPTRFWSDNGKPKDEEEARSLDMVRFSKNANSF